MSELLQNLQPATPDRPPITLSRGDLIKPDPSIRTPVVEGLLSLRDQQQKPTNPNDSIVFSVRGVDSLGKLGDEILVGAKIPVSGVRFPLRFQMFEKNILPGKVDKVEGDLMIRAEVCPSIIDGVSVFPCPPESVTMDGEGLSKVITKANLPSLDEGVGIRVAAAVQIKAATAKTD